MVLVVVPAQGGFFGGTFLGDGECDGMSLVVGS